MSPSLWMQLAAQKFRAALALYRKIQDPYSSGAALKRLARLEDDRSKRQEMIAEIVAAWQGIDRQDLVDGLAGQFPEELRAAGKGRAGSGSK